MSKDDQSEPEMLAELVSLDDFRKSKRGRKKSTHFLGDEEETETGVKTEISAGETTGPKAELLAETASSPKSLPTPMELEGLSGKADEREKIVEFFAANQVPRGKFYEWIKAKGYSAAFKHIPYSERGHRNSNPDPEFMLSFWLNKSGWLDDETIFPVDFDEDTSLVITGAALREWIYQVETAFEKIKAPFDKSISGCEVDYKTGSELLNTWTKIAQSVREMPAEADQDCAWVLSQAAESAVLAAEGITGVLVAEIFHQLAELQLPASLQPVDLLRCLRALERGSRNCILNGMQDHGPRNFERTIIALLYHLETQPTRLSFYDILNRAWTVVLSWASNEAYSGYEHLEGRCILLIFLLAQALETYDKLTKETTTAAFEISRSILDDFSLSNKNEVDREKGETAHPCQDYLEISWKGTLSITDAQKLVSKLNEQRIYGLFSGHCDVFGVGPATLWVRAKNPQQVLALLDPRAGYAVIRHPGIDSGRIRREMDAPDFADPLSLNAWNVVMFEERSGREPIHPAVLVLTDSSGLVAELAQGGAKVVWTQNQTSVDLLEILKSFQEKVVLAVPSCINTSSRLAQLGREAQLAGIQVLVAPSNNGLQASEVARGALPLVSAHTSDKQMAELLRARAFKALENIRTLEITADEQLDILANMINPEDYLARILVREGEDSNLIAKLHLTLAEASTSIRTDLLQGNQSTPTVVGLMNLKP